MAKRIPGYRHHKPTGQAVVTLDGKDCYLGKHGSPKSHKKYAALLSEWQAKQTAAPVNVTVRQLTVLYRRHAEKHYFKNGKPTSEFGLVVYSLKYMNRVAKDLPLAEFSPRYLKLARELMIKAGMTRGTVNKFTQRIRRSIKWAVGEELCPASVLVGLQAVPDLVRGRSTAPDLPPVKPVPEAFIKAIRKHVHPPVWGMIQFQLATGARPGEAISVRACDLDTSGEIWIYMPESHKTQHHGKARVICIGPAGQTVLQEHMTTDLQAYVFGTVKSGGKKPYRRDSYTNAIVRGCELAFDMPDELRYVSRHVARQKSLTNEEREALRVKLLKEAAKWRAEHCWSPNQLRHNFATRARREFGIEAARVTLGHSSAVTSEIYAERDLDAARAVVAKIG